MDVPQADPQDAKRLIVIPNLGISRFRKKPIKDTVTWS